jgi:hypothetical protein
MRGIERDVEIGRKGEPRTQGTPAVLFLAGQVLFRPNPATCEPRKPERPENP